VIVVDPVLTVAGTAVALTDTGPGLVGIDALSLTWGRSSVLERPTPATLSLSLLDTTPGATFARRGDLKGQPVVLGWTTAGGASTGTNFQGRITDTALRPRPAGGFLLDLQCASKEADAANWRFDKGTTFPAETAAARQSRIFAALPSGYFAGGIAMAGPDSTDGYDPSAWALGSLDASELDCLSLLADLYDTVSYLPLMYDPQHDTLTHTPARRVHAAQPGNGPPGWVYTYVGQLLADPARAGRYRPYPVSALSLAVDALDLDFAGALNDAIDGRITRVEVSWTDPAGSLSGTRSSQIQTAAQEALTGRSVLSINSWLKAGADATSMAVEYGNVAGLEGAARRLDPVTYSTARTGGFDSVNHARALLTGCELGWELFLGRSWLPALGECPVYGVVGGTVTYAGGEWTAVLTPAAVGLNYAGTTPGVPTALRIADAGAHTLAEMDDALTLGDMAFVQVSAGYTTATQPMPMGA
jgi:hypothetical protein